MSAPDHKPETPVTQEWVGTLLVGYFIGGPLLTIAFCGILWLFGWMS